MKRDAAVAIFVKTPGYSPVKTRLAATLGRAWAEEFHCRAAAATAAAAGEASGRCAVYWAVAEQAAVAHPLWAGLPALWQGEGELGQRMARIYARLQSAYREVLLIGADTPQITAEHLHRALHALQTAPFVLGPARDGGFWLFGGRRAVLEATWTTVHYSRADTATQFVAAVSRYGEVARLDTLADADSADDLPHVHAALTRLPAPLSRQRTLGAWMEHNLPAKLREQRLCFSPSGPIQSLQPPPESARTSPAAPCTRTTP